MIKEVKDLLWFKMDIEAFLKDYEVNHRFYDDGDFGSLTQIEFNSKEKGGNIDFWGLGWLGVYLWDYKKEKEIINVLLKPNQVEEQKKLFIELKSLL